MTSVLSMLPKPFLTFWAAKVTAETAVSNIGPVVGLAMNDPSGAVDYLKRAHRRTTNEAADVGTEVHGLYEKLARGDAVGRQHPDLEPYVRHIGEFHDKYQPRYRFIEDAVWSDTYKYAGSFDAICDIEGETVMLDAKSTRSGVHEEVALQLSAYSYADRIVTQSGEHAEVPEIHAGAVLHLRPEGWKLVPARVDSTVFDYFLTLRKVFDWVTTESSTVIGAPLFESVASTGSERRATTK
ncbi:hypothetical protein [Amycolatopsis sp. NPDC059657]|uniref:hypothetical protein n=1 Tax=Amycolatopsis sp. NPDC059657 TaxID=3346899 RepID=UPI00366BFC79